MAVAAPLPLLAGISPATLTVALLLAVIALAFIFRFLLPSLRLGRELAAAIRQLTACHTQGKTTPQQVATAAMQSPRLARIWQEYAATLHPVLAPSARTEAWRASGPAAAFFSEHALVDTPLATEFYKHVPGILTGLGILGTFFGLIGGLSDFAVASDASAVRASLNALVHGVGEAFHVSAAAIGLAMLITWVEKSQVTARYRQVTRLVQEIDTLFAPGAGEAYLQRLVNASESSARQGESLREAIAAGLRDVFAEQLRQQQEQLQQQQQMLATAVTRAVVEGLRPPLTRIAETLSETQRQQGSALAERLEQALDRLTERIAQQQADAGATVHAAFRDTGATLAEAISRLGNTAERLDAAARQATAAIGEARQLAGGQANALGTAVSEDLRRLAADVRAAGAATREGSTRIATAQDDAMASIAEAVTALRSACTELAGATRGMSQTGQMLETGAQRVEQASNRFAGAAHNLGQTLGSQETVQRDLLALTGEMQRLLDEARREAGLSTSLVDRIEAGASQLAGAGQRAEDYLQQINSVLDAAHAAFARNIERSLREGNRHFQEELAEAIGHLKRIVEEIGDVCEAALARSN